MAEAPGTGPESKEAEEIKRLREELRLERAHRQTLEFARESLQAAFEKLEGGVLLLDKDRVLFANPAVSEMFDIPADRLHRMSRDQFLREIAGLFDDPPDFLRRMRDRSVGALEDREDFEIQLPRWRRMRWVGKTLQLPSGEGQLAIFTDITADADLASDRESRAMMDALTGLSNRRAGEQVVAQEAARAQRAGRVLSFVLFDIDHFKRVNDTHGHRAGDAVLREVGRYMRALLRRGDTAVRWGGEEFLIILADVGLQGARAFAERVRGAVELMEAGEVGRITISAGASELQSGEDVESALARADANLYEAKSRGRNRVC